MVINTDAIGLRAERRQRAWSQDDTMLYALAVGAGVDDLELTTENSENTELVALPSFAAVLAGGAGPLRGALGSWPATSLVHGAQWIEFDRPLQPEGRIDIDTVVTAIEDKGSGALIELTAEASDSARGDRIFRSTTGLFIRGEGGFGDLGAPARTLPPAPQDSPPDLEVTAHVRDDQALLYRLCGDRNPLHSDPVFAHRAGFPRPILHGLCTWGFAARMLAKGALGGDYRRIRGFGGRFRAPVLPGSDLQMRAWHLSGSRWSFELSSANRVVIDCGVLEEADW